MQNRWALLTRQNGPWWMDWLKKITDYINIPSMRLEKRRKTRINFTTSSMFWERVHLWLLSSQSSEFYARGSVPSKRRCLVCPLNGIIFSNYPTSIDCNYNIPIDPDRPDVGYLCAWEKVYETSSEKSREFGLYKFIKTKKT